MAKEALEGWLEAHLADGQVPPQPRQRTRAPKGAKLWRVEIDPGIAVAMQIRWARADAGLTQAQLAKRAGVAQQQIAKLERPGENPSIATLHKVAKALNVPFDVTLGARRKVA
jgi:DNA-binding XRE family transcriptional regulator